MADFSTICSHFNSNDLPHFMFYLKSQKPIKFVIWHLPVSIPAVDISGEFVNLGLNVISIKQMPTTHRSPAVNISLYLITLPRMSKSLEIFQLMSLCIIAIRVEAYKTQSYNCQQFGQVLLYVVWGLSPVQGMLGEGQYSMDTNMLQLKVGG
jgi:hypothetical protein